MQKIPGREVLFSTPHGSHLYNLAHADSDRDTYTVVTRSPHVQHNGTRARYAKQKIRDGEDAMVLDLSTFMLLCDKGAPQALEAMFSPSPTTDLIKNLRGSYRVSTAVLPTYLRTIKHFTLAGDFKRRRHALRLAMNANELDRTGRFNPTLTSMQAEVITKLATRHEAEACLEIAKNIFWEGVFE